MYVWFKRKIVRAFYELVHKNDYILVATIKILIQINNNILKLEVNVCKWHFIKYEVLSVDKNFFVDD